MNLRLLLVNVSRFITIWLSQHNELALARGKELMQGCVVSTDCYTS